MLVMTGKMKGKYYFCGQSSRHVNFHDDLFFTLLLFHYEVLFLDHSQSLSPDKEQWLSHTVGNHIFKEVKINAVLITVCSD